MIRNIRIKNFKAIKDLTIELTPFTVLIGENSSGKSTVIQALDFLCSIASRDIDEYLKDRDWEFDEIKSHFSAPDDSVCFTTDICINEVTLLWEISINNCDGKWQIKESICNAVSNECYLSYGCQPHDMPFDFSQLNIKSSALKMLDIDRTIPTTAKFDPVLFGLKSLLSSSNSFELLSPDRMRSRGSRGKPDNIGIGGEKLAAYIHGMLPHKKNELNKLLSDFIGYEIKITTTTKGQPGWVEMYLVETWDNKETKIKKRYISDGLLRIIALSAILVAHESKKSSQQSPTLENGYLRGLIMLDEIEDGISPDYSEKLIEYFRKMVVDMKRQVVVTSHSPVMLNFVDETDIQFMWRDNKGNINVKPLFMTDEMKGTLDILGPGEVWLNYPKETIIERISMVQEGAHD